MEEKLWVRLREDLGTQVLKQTQEQSAQVMGSATTMIEQKISQSLVGFRQQVTQQLQTVAQNAQGLSEEIAEAVGQHFNSGAEKFQQQVAEAGNRAGRKRRRTLPLVAETAGRRARRVSGRNAEDAEHGGRRGFQVAGASYVSGRSHGAVGRYRLPAGIRNGNAFVHMASDQISAARVQLETAVDVVLKELGTRNAKELDRQLDEARGKLKIVQKGIETSVNDLVKTEVAASLLSFGQTMEELAQDSVGRWRSALSRDLTSVAKILGGGFQMESSNRSEEKGAHEED